VDLENNKNLIVVSSILTVGVSGLFLFSSSFAGVSLAMVVGVILNLLLGIKKHKGEN
jgi:xanthine/uracil permease